MSKISDTERRLFAELHASRVKANEVFNQRDFRGIKPNVVDKYAETAHFVYELLQNADDANATEVTITLKANQLLFKHNGTKHVLKDAIKDKYGKYHDEIIYEIIQ